MKEQRVKGLSEITEFLTTVIDPKDLAKVFERVITDYSLLLLDRGEKGRIYDNGDNTISDIYFLLQIKDILNRIELSTDN